MKGLQKRSIIELENLIDPKLGIVGTSCGIDLVEIKPVLKRPTLSLSAKEPMGLLWMRFQRLGSGMDQQA